jgi:hypothetical protein
MGLILADWCNQSRFTAQAEARTERSRVVRCVTVTSPFIPGVREVAAGILLRAARAAHPEVAGAAYPGVAREEREPRVAL